MVNFFNHLIKRHIVTQISFLDCPGRFFIERPFLNVYKSKRGLGAPAINLLALSKNVFKVILMKNPLCHGVT